MLRLLPRGSRVTATEKITLRRGIREGGAGAPNEGTERGVLLHGTGYRPVGVRPPSRHGHMSPCCVPWREGALGPNCEPAQPAHRPTAF